MNNDFLVTREVICQWFSLVTSLLVKIVGKSPHSWLKIVIHGSSCIILYISTFTHLPLVPHICVGELDQHLINISLKFVLIDNNLALVQIIWTNARLLSIRTNFSEMLIKVQCFSFTKMHLKISSAKWQPICPWWYVLKASYRVYFMRILWTVL